MSTTSNDFVFDDGPDVDESTVVLHSGRTLTPSVVEEIVNATRAASPVGRPSLSRRSGKSPLMTFRLSDELDTAVNQTGIARSQLGRDALEEYLRNHYPHLVGKKAVS